MFLSIKSPRQYGLIDYSTQGRFYSWLVNHLLIGCKAGVNRDCILGEGEVLIASLYHQTNK